MTTHKFIIKCYKIAVSFANYSTLPSNFRLFFLNILVYCFMDLIESCPFVLTFQILRLTLCTASFNIQKFYILPTQCIYVFCVDFRTNSYYFSLQQ